METIASVLGYAATAAYAALLLGFLIRYFGGALKLKAEPEGQLPDNETGTPARWGRVVAVVLICFFASRLLILLTGTAGAMVSGDSYYTFSNLPYNWAKWDSRHYIDIAQDFYVNEGDERLSIVFYPLYPLIVRGLYLLGLPAMTGAYLVSNLCLLGAGFVLHALMREDRGVKAANRAVFFLMFAPQGLFFSIPYTESLFVLLCLLVSLMCRRRKYFLAICFGALCSATRSLGILTAPVIFYFLLRDAWESYAASRPEARRRDGAFLAKVVLCVLKVLPVALGLVFYLDINYAVTGNAFTFLTYQREHWSQTFGSLLNTVRYSFVNAVTYGNFNYRICLWIPQTASVFLCLGLMFAARRRMHPADASFAILYFYCAMAPTWLLSGPRYLTALYAVYPALALLAERKLPRVMLYVLTLGLLVYFSWQYIVAGVVL